jgi:hypothetical protein
VALQIVDNLALAELGAEICTVCMQGGLTARSCRVVGKEPNSAVSFKVGQL